MKKFASALGLAAAIAAASAAPGLGADVTIRAAHVFASSFSSHTAIADFAERVKAKTNGAVEVAVFPEGQLGNERELLEGATLGSHDISLTGAAGWAIINPRLGTFELPFLYRDMEHQRHVFTGELAGVVDALFAEKGLKYLGYFAYGVRSTLTTTHPVETLESFRGLKIRVPEVPIFVKTFAALGANPTPINFGEVYTALQSGVVEGVEGSPESLLAQKFSEVARYLTMTMHQSPPILVAMNKAAFDRLSPEHQQAVLEAAREASDALYDRVLKANEDAVVTMAAAGVTVVEVSEQERARIQQAVQVVYDELGSQYQSGELLDRIRAVE